MANNKKPRKKYTPRLIINPLARNEKYLDEVRTALSELELLVEMKLPQGNCNDDDMFHIRDFINWGIIAMVNRDEFNDEERASIIALCGIAAKDITTIQKRGRERNNSFICKAEELQHIRDIIPFLANFFRESLNTCPIRTAKEHQLMRKLSYSKVFPLKVTRSYIKKMLR